MIDNRFINLHALSQDRSVDEILNLASNLIKKIEPNSFLKYRYSNLRKCGQGKKSTWEQKKNLFSLFDPKMPTF